MQLQTLLQGFADVHGDISIAGLSSDTRKLSQDQVFFALENASGHGLQYADQAIAKGARAIIYDPKTIPDLNAFKYSKVLPVIAIEDLNRHLGTIAARFYAQPSSHLDIIGITGTNGKTSCTQFLGQLLENCGIIGTLGWGCWSDLIATGYTTPDALTTQAILAECVQRQLQTVAMEVSSHGVAEYRINGIVFKGVALTNISRDHLDFHGSMDAYIETKKRLFAHPETQFAVINLDDPLSEEFIAVVPKHTAIWGFSTGSTKRPMRPLQQLIVAGNIKHQADGLCFDAHWQDQVQTIQAPLYGLFNIENLLTVIAVMLALGRTLAEIADKIARLQPVAGRMQSFGHRNSALIFVDYAHTPDALQKVLISARRHCTEKLWVVFGCGGDRDAGKRPEMGLCAEQYADHVILTDDNPRSEEPQQIVKDILAGCKREPLAVIHNRADAIRYAVEHASTQDCIVIAGKGHEQFQEYKSRKIPFTDAEAVTRALSAGMARA